MTQLAPRDTSKASPATGEFLFVNADVPESEILLAGLAPQVEVVRLPGDCDGVARITQALAGRTGIAALHILGHGEQGRIELGGTTLSLGSLDAAAVDLQAWRRSLAPGADILLYGCDVAGSAEGIALVERLAELTGADVAASADATGAAALGGNWMLETRTGGIEAALPFSAEARSAWRHTLNHFRYGTMSWGLVPAAPNTVIVKSQIDFTGTNAFIPSATPVGGIVADKIPLRFGDGTTQNVSLRIISRDAATDDVVAEFVSDLDGNGTIDASEVGVRHSYATTGQYKVAWDSSTRTTARNTDGGTWQQVTTIDLARAGNRSPTTSTPALVQVKDNAVFTYQLGASDPDGNTVRFRYGTQDEFYKNGVLTEATRPTGLMLTPQGLITWDVSDGVLATAPGDRWQVTVMAEDLDAGGNVLSSVPLDFALGIVSATGQPAVFNQIPSGPQQTISGQTSTFQVVMDDPDTATGPVVTVLNPPSTDPAVFSTTSTTDANGVTTLTFSFTPTQAMQGNSYVVNIRGRDADGLTSDGSVTLVVPDTTPPAVPSALGLAAASDSGTAGDGRTNVAQPAIVGTAEPGSTVELYEGATLLGTATANGAGRWSITPASALAEGAHGLTATAADPVGNVSAASGAFTLTIDTTAPAAPLIPVLAAASDSGVAGDDLTNVVRPAITGTAAAGSAVTLYDGATLLGTAAADGAGSWSITPAPALAEGARSLTATATDAAGNTSAFSPALALTIDTVAPSAPPSPVLDLASDSGAAGDNLTNVVRPTITGTAAAGSTVALYDGATLLGTTTADGAGGWSVTPAAGLADGLHNVTATAADAAGNVSAASAALALTIDTTTAAPTGLALAAASDSGAAGDGLTNVVRPSITGTAEPGSSITLTEGAALLGTATTDGAGRWSITPASALAEGTHDLSATATDAAGNVSAASATFALTIDTTPPAAPAALSLAAASDSGVQGDGLTNVGRPTITGTAEAGISVSLTDGAILIGTGTAASDGAWSITAASPLTEGANALTATASDAAGNVSAASGALNVTLDATVPAAPAALAIASADDSGAAGDGITSVASPILTGTAEAGSTVTLTDGAAVLGTTQADGAGLWRFTPAALAEGVHSITATATDAAGNASPASAALALSIDTAAPVVAMSLSQDTGLDYDRITTNPTLTGSADAGGTVLLSEGGAALGTATADAAGLWSFTPAGLAEGSHTIAASSTDAAGNTGAASLSFVLVTSAPTTDYTLVDGSGAMSEGVLTPAGQDASGVARRFAYGGTGGATILARADDASLKGGGGDDAIVARGGRNVLDGNGGSDWLVGGTGQNSFVVDARGGTWNTVLGFKAGDDATVRGIGGGASDFRWIGVAGADGYQGATLRGVADATGQAFSLTFTGLTVEEAKRYAAVVERDADGTSTLRLRAPSAAAPDDASYQVTDLTTGIASTGMLDPYQGTAAGLRYQRVESGDASAVLLAKASDSLLKSGAGNDALVVRNGDNVLDAGGGSNWLVGGAGNDTFLVDAPSSGQSVWDTIVNFHAGDVLTMRGYQEGVSSWGWTAGAEGAAGYEGATLRGALNGRDADFSLTLAGISVEQARGFAVSSATGGDGVGALSIRA